jgi:hypothetical protein
MARTLRNGRSPPSIVRSPSGKQHQHPADAQPAGGHTHGVMRCPIGIDRDDVAGAGEGPHEWGLKVLGRAHEEHVLEMSERQAAATRNPSRYDWWFGVTMNGPCGGTGAPANLKRTVRRATSTMS